VKTGRNRKAVAHEGRSERSFQTAGGIVVSRWLSPATQLMSYEEFTATPLSRVPLPLLGGATPNGTTVNCKDSQRSGRGLTEVLWRNFREGTEENHGTFGQCNWCLGRNSTRPPLEFMSTALPPGCLFNYGSLREADSHSAGYEIPWKFLREPSPRAYQQLRLTQASV
jgi:hypothetical protein